MPIFYGLEIVMDIETATDLEIIWEMLGNKMTWNYGAIYTDFK